MVEEPHSRQRQAADRAGPEEQPNKIRRTGGEHIFGAQANHMGGTLVQTVRLARAKAKIGIKHLVYNMCSLGQLLRLNPCPA